MAELRRINKADTVSREDAALIARLGASAIQVGDRELPLLTNEEIACLLIPRGNLTPDERREIERHPAESFRILSTSPSRKTWPGCSPSFPNITNAWTVQATRPASRTAPSCCKPHHRHCGHLRCHHHGPPLQASPAPTKGPGHPLEEAQAGRIDQGLVELLDQHIETVEADCEALPERLDFAEYLTRPLPVVA